MDRKNLTLQDVTALLLNRVDSLEEKLTNAIAGYAPPKIMTQTELAEYLGVSVVTIIKYAGMGVIPEIRVGSCVKYDLHKVLQALERKKRK